MSQVTQNAHVEVTQKSSLLHCIRATYRYCYWLKGVVEEIGDVPGIRREIKLSVFHVTDGFYLQEKIIQYS